jgi:SAM-dependent methyltransferase
MGADGSAAAVYDTIGVGYADVRRPDPRIARRLHAALGAAETVVNVGAGAGSYEPTDRRVVAVEPSAAMVAQRPPGSAPVVRGEAGRLPFADRAFDAALALLTVHHWPDRAAGLADLRRVTAGPIVVFTFDKSSHDDQWLTAEYLPEVGGLDEGHPEADELAAALGGGTVEPLPVPHDCTDGFLHAYWRRPEAYLRPEVRAGISGIARLPEDVVGPAMARLADDLASGAWHARHHDLLDRDELDAGYRLVVSPGA